MVEPLTNTNLWKIYTIDIVNNSLSVIKPTFINMEWEGVLKETGASDFIGGYHGDERATSIHVLVDGTEVNINGADFTTFVSDEVKIVNKSVLNSYFSQTNDLFNRIKISTWNKENYTVENIWESLAETELTISYVTMLSLPRQIGDTDFVSWVRNDVDYIKTDVNSVEQVGAMIPINGSKAKCYEMWGETSGIYAKVECVADFVKWNNCESFATNSQENIIKVYFDLTNTHHGFTVGEKMKSKSIYTIRI